MKTLENIHVSSSPHIRNNRTTRSIMIDVCIALLPACAMGIVAFGWRAAVILLVSVVSCVLTEYIYQLLMKHPITVGDFSAVVTGLILGCNLPATVPFWLPALGGIFAILIVKQLFGGLGQNFMNPALAARCFLVISFAALMTKFPDSINQLWVSVDAVSSATPLQALRNGESVNAVQMLFDLHNGCIGEASSLAVLLGAAYLFVRRVITPTIPLIFVGSTIAFIALFQAIGGNAEVLTLGYLTAQVCGGGLLIGAFFMANDYVTSPLSVWGCVIYAVLLGLLTSLFRVLGSSSEGVSYAIIIGNCIVPLIDRITIPKPFGREGGSKK